MPLAPLCFPHLAPFLGAEIQEGQGLGLGWSGRRNGQAQLEAQAYKRTGSVAAKNTDVRTDVFALIGIMMSLEVLNALLPLVSLFGPQHHRQGVRSCGGAPQDPTAAGIADNDGSERLLWEALLDRRSSIYAIQRWWT